MLKVNPQVALEQKLHLRNDLHVIRKLWHIFAGVFGMTLYIHLDLPSIVVAHVLMGVGLTAFTLDFLRLKIPAFNILVLKVMGAFMRESEKDSLSGLPFYALGVSISLYLFPERLAVLAILFLIFADPISSYFGVMFGKDKITSNKSLQGSCAGFITCYFLSLCYGILYAQPGIELFLFSVFAGLIGSASELLSEFVDDNLSIPVASGFGLTFLNLFIPLY